MKMSSTTGMIRTTAVISLLMWCAHSMGMDAANSSVGNASPRRLRRNMAQQHQQQQESREQGPPELVVSVEDELWEQFLRRYDMSMPTNAPNLPPFTVPVPTKMPILLPPPAATTVPIVIIPRPPMPTRQPPVQPPTRPTTTRPVTVAPVPSTQRPVPTTRAPKTMTMTKRPTTLRPLPPPTSAPVAPIPTLQPVSPPSQTPLSPPRTAAPVASKAPTNAPKVIATKAPLSKAPAVVPTKSPVTLAPAIAPVTKAPATLAPVTKAPQTRKPVTRGPVTNFPVSNAPVSKAPITKSPVSKAPATRSPVSKAPVSKAPITSAPVSKSPVSRAPAPAPIPPLPVARPTTAPVSATPNVTLLALIQNTPELSTLLSAIQSADANRNTPPFLAPLLGSSTSSLTVFAPTNTAFNAFEALVPNYLSRLLTPEYGLHLFSLLGYHVTQGDVLTSRFPLSNLRMFASGFVNVTGSTAGGFQVESFAPVDANLLPPANIRATNGVAHLVDNVLVPRFVGQNLVTTLELLNEEQGGRFSTLLELITASDLGSTLAAAEGVTLLAPSNDAIAPETAEFLLRPENADILKSVVSYHVIDELFNFAAQSVPNILLVDTLQDENIVVGLVILDDNSIATTYNQATQEEFFVTQENIGYVIDTLLIPPSLNNVVPNVVNAVSLIPL